MSRRIANSNKYYRSMSLDNPVYYTGDTVEITGDPTSSKTLYRNAGNSTFADVFVNTIDELTLKDVKKTTLKFIAKNAAGNVITKSYEVIVNPDSETFTVPGVAADLLGSTAVSVAVGGALTLAVGPGAAIIFAAAGSVVLWEAIKDTDVVDDFFDELNNTVDTNIELAGLDGKNNDGYNVSFIPKNDASLFGYDLGRIALDISDGSYFDNNGNLIQGGTIFNSISIPTDAQFANKDSLFFDLLITANAPRNEVENSIFVSVNERASSSERTPFTLTSDNGGEETSDEIPEESTIEESPKEPIDEETSESKQPSTDEEEIAKPPVNENEPEQEDTDFLVDGVPGNNSSIDNSQETEIQLQIFSPDLESPITEPLISVIRIEDEYTELSTLGSDTSDLVPVDVNIDLDFGTETGRISFEVDENEGSGSFAPGEFNGYVFTDVFDEIPAIENVTLSETANSLGLESSDLTFTENTIEVNVESLAYSPGLDALLDVEFADF